MRIGTLFLAAAFVVCGTAAHALISGGGPAGTNFSCDVNKSSCSCDGVLEGADCQAMLKNCKGGVNPNCFHGTGGAWCECSMSKAAAPKGKLPQKLPTAPAQQQQ
jgi:hypothetical protein